MQKTTGLRVHGRIGESDRADEFDGMPVDD